jgi:hypothetical protein
LNELSCCKAIDSHQRVMEPFTIVRPEVSTMKDTLTHTQHYPIRFIPRMHKLQTTFASFDLAMTSSIFSFHDFGFSLSSALSEVRLVRNPPKCSSPTTFAVEEKTVALEKLLEICYYSFISLCINELQTATYEGAATQGVAMTRHRSETE